MAEQEEQGGFADAPEFHVVDEDGKTEEDYRTERYASDDADNGPTYPRLPDVHVQLGGEDGNAFFMIGRTGSAIRRAGYKAEADEFEREAFDSQSYDDVIQLIMRTVEVS